VVDHLRIAYLRGEGGTDEIQTAMKALETAGCDRIVFDSTPRHRAESRAALLSFLAQMKEGDDLVVTNLDQLASTTPRLIEILASLVGRGITVETISGEIDTADPATSRILDTLWKFEERGHQGRKPAALIALEPGAGRPRRLSATEITSARALIDGGRPVAEVARELHVSRATLYRSLKRA
jgi:DNA invertase Pin-like site-specific DNA recombinase